jgi:hypothetical protein
MTDTNFTHDPTPSSLPRDTEPIELRRNLHRVPSSSRDQREKPPSDVPAWLTVCLCCLLAGTALAKFTHLQTGVLIHPGVVLGTVAVVLSMGMALLATMHRVVAGIRFGGDSAVSQTLATLGAFLILVLGWAALTVIYFAPPGQAAGDVG